MNQEKPEPSSLSEAEARIVAWILGESSEFEASQIDELCQSDSSIKEFREVTRRLHHRLLSASLLDCLNRFSLQELSEIKSKAGVPDFEIELLGRLEILRRDVLSQETSLIGDSLNASQGVQLSEDRRRKILALCESSDVEVKPELTGEVRKPATRTFVGSTLVASRLTSLGRRSVDRCCDWLDDRFDGWNLRRVAGLATVAGLLVICFMFTITSPRNLMLSESMDRDASSNPWFGRGMLGAPAPSAAAQAPMDSMDAWGFETADSSGIEADMAMDLGMAMMGEEMEESAVQFDLPEIESDDLFEAEISPLTSSIAPQLPDPTEDRFSNGNGVDPGVGTRRLSETRSRQRVEGRSSEGYSGFGEDNGRERDFYFRSGQSKPQSASSAPALAAEPQANRAIAGQALAGKESGGEQLLERGEMDFEQSFGRPADNGLALGFAGGAMGGIGGGGGGGLGGLGVQQGVEKDRAVLLDDRIEAKRSAGVGVNKSLSDLSVAVPASPPVGSNAPAQAGRQFAEREFGVPPSRPLSREDENLALGLSDQPVDATRQSRRNIENPTSNLSLGKTIDSSGRLSGSESDRGPVLAPSDSTQAESGEVLRESLQNEVRTESLGRMQQQGQAAVDHDIDGLMDAEIVDFADASNLGDLFSASPQDGFLKGQQADKAAADRQESIDSLSRFKQSEVTKRKSLSGQEVPEEMAAEKASLGKVNEKKEAAKGVMRGLQPMARDTKSLNRNARDESQPRGEGEQIAGQQIAGQRGTAANNADGSIPAAKTWSIESKKLDEVFQEVKAAQTPFSTFSLHVSDVSFKLAKAALAGGQWPDVARIRIEEFVNAIDYGDPMPSQSERVACRIEQSIHPFLQQRNLLRISMRTAATGRASTTPLNLTFLLDNSGSMERIDRRNTVRRCFEVLAGQLHEGDEVTLISFASQPRLLAERLSGKQAADVLRVLDQLPSEGGTNLEAALMLAGEKAREYYRDDAQNRVVLITDGAVNLGDADPDSLSRQIRSLRDAGIAFDAAGIGADGLNDEVLEALTRKGDGRYYLLDSQESVEDGFARQIAGALRPAAKNVKVQVEFNPQRVGMYNLLGFEQHRLKKEDFRNDQVDAAEMAAAEAGVAVYQVQVKPDGFGDLGSVSVRFQDLESGQMVEERWPITFDGNVPRMDQATESMKLAGSAALFAMKLKDDARSETVDLSFLREVLGALPSQRQQDPRVLALQQMVDQARQMLGPASGRE